jgi:hypothetical protein
MFFHINIVMIFSESPIGCLVSRTSVGGSVAKPRAANVSMIILIQSIFVVLNKKKLLG